MGFSEKLTELRRKAGLSQEQLADRLGVTRQSVSKWESGAAMPELNKLIAVSDLFGVSVDYLVKDTVESSAFSAEEAQRDVEHRLDRLEGAYRENFAPWFRYTSRKRLWGIPLVSVCFGRDRRPSRNSTAVGIIAIGNFSVGVISIGLISVGLLSVGMLAFGGVSVGMVSMGWASAGVSTIGAHVKGVSALKL